MNFIELRDEPTAQWEIQQYAKVLKEIMLEVFPETTQLWSETHLH
jgi:thymidylate synthase ThyX